MRDYDPITGNRVDRNPELLEPRMAERESGMTTLGILVALVLVIGAGVYFFGIADNPRVASNTAPSATTGQSTTPSPSNPPPMKGQSESDSTR